MTTIANAPDIITPNSPNMETPRNKGGMLARIRIDDPTAIDDIKIARTSRLIVFLMSDNPLIL